MDEPGFDEVAAALRRDARDAATYARVLTETLGDTLPSGWVEVERDRTLADRMRGRPGTVRRVVIRLGDRSLSLTVEGDRARTEIAHEVRGVVLSRDEVTLDAWVADLARRMTEQAADNARDYVPPGLEEEYTRFRDLVVESTLAVVVQGQDPDAVLDDMQAEIDRMLR